MMPPANHPPITKEEHFLAHLRQATAAQHKQLEATNISANLLRADVSKEMYMNYLAHMQGVIAFAEQQVYPTLAHLFADMPSRQKLAAINSDMDVLAQQVPLPQSKPLNSGMKDRGVATAMGYMYVIEGSTLGGRILLKHIKNTLGYDEQAGARFFSGYGAETGTLWKSFLAVLTSYAVREGQEEEVIKGANQAFAAIENHFS